LTHQAFATLYTNGPHNGNGGNGQGNGHSPSSVVGRSLAHSHLTASQRAAVAAKLVLGEARLIAPTITQVVPIVHVSTPYVRVALELVEETRARVAMGELLSLSDAAKANGLLAAWLTASPVERAALGTIVGADEVWADAVLPSL
jgi:hypothetical protein